MKLFNFDCPASIDLTAAQVAEVICYAFEKRYGIKLDVNRLEVKYNQPDYDVTEFDGYRISLTMEEAIQTLGG